MKLSNNFTLAELCNSAAAKRFGMSLTPEGDLVYDAGKLLDANKYLSRFLDDDGEMFDLMNEVGFGEDDVEELWGLVDGIKHHLIETDPEYAKQLKLKDPEGFEVLMGERLDYFRPLIGCAVGDGGQHSQVWGKRSTGLVS